MKKVLELGVLDEKVYLISDVNELINYFLYDEEYVPETIPGFKARLVNDTEYLSLNHASIIHYENSRLEYVLMDDDKNRLFVSCEYDKLYKPDLVYYALCMFAKELNKNNMYLVHCSVVEKNGISTVLMGEAGSGKTTLALFLCTEYGYNFVCNDRAVIGFKDGKPYVYVGTLQTHIRVGVINKFFPQFMSSLDPVLLDQPWKNKMYINPKLDELGVRIVNESFIGYMYFMYTFDSLKETAYMDRYLKNEEYDACLAVQERISEYNRACRNVILSLDQPFPSFDNSILAAIRLNASKNIVNSVKLAELRGTVKGVAKLIYDEQFKAI